MICKCPKCNQYTTGVIDKFIYAGICGRDGYKEVDESASELGENVDKLAQKKLGKFIGKTAGKVSKGTLGVVSEAVGQARWFAHSIGALMDTDKPYCFQCKNKECGHEWVIPVKEAQDCSEEFYSKREIDFLATPSKKYLVVDPNATVAYESQNNTFMLRALPQGINISDHVLNYGEIYVSHPGNPNLFFSLESYRIKVLEDELNDLKQFLIKLGAASIEITGMTDTEISNAEKSKTETNTKGGNAAVETTVDSYSEREDNAYRRLRTLFKSKVKTEREENIIIDSQLLRKWDKVNPEWKRILEIRQSGAIEYSFCIETEAITNSKKMELDKVCASYSEFGTGVNTQYVNDTISQLKEAKRMSFTVDVIFHPKSAYTNFELIEQ